MELLEQKGYIPIRIAGNYGNGINFINAIAHKRNDGGLVYITNSSQSSDELLSSFEEKFERDLKEKIPNLKKVYFIQGTQEKRKPLKNYMMTKLYYQNGGIHCLTTEGVNFEKWG